MTRFFDVLPHLFLGLFRLFSPELVDLQLDLPHAVLVELFPVSEEEENLQHHEQRGRDEGLLPGVQQGRGSTLKYSVSDELSDPHDHMEDNDGLQERISLHWSIGCHQL